MNKQELEDAIIEFYVSYGEWVHAGRKILGLTNPDHITRETMITRKLTWDRYCAARDKIIPPSPKKKITHAMNRVMKH